MKTILSTIFLAIILTGCSGATFTESYEKTPASAKSIGEGKDTYKMVYQGKSYILVKGTDGRYYAVAEGDRK